MNHRAWVDKYIRMASAQQGDDRVARAAVSRAKDAVSLRKGRELSVFADGSIDMCVAACGLMALLARRNKDMPRGMSKQRDMHARQSIQRVNEDSRELLRNAQKSVDNNDRMYSAMTGRKTLQRQVNIKTMAGRYFTACQVVGMLLDDYGDSNGRRLISFGDTGMYKVERTSFEEYGTSTDPYADSDRVFSQKFQKSSPHGADPRYRGGQHRRTPIGESEKYNVIRHGQNEFDSSSEN